MNNRFDDRGMGDHMLPLVWAGMSLVVFLDPVWFEDDAVVGFDEVSRKFKSVDRLFNEPPNGRSIFVAVGATKDGDALQRQLCEGFEHDACCLLQYGDFATPGLRQAGLGNRMPWVYRFSLR